VALCVFGVDLTAGNVIVPWFAERLRRMDVSSKG
jgi:hypothetical protein